MTPAQILGNTFAAFHRLSKGHFLVPIASNGQKFGESFVAALQSGGFTVVSHGYVASLEKRIRELEEGGVIE